MGGRAISEQRGRKVLEKLYEQRQIPDEGFQSLQGYLSNVGPATFVRQLMDSGVPSGAVASAISEVLDFPMWAGSKLIKTGKDWVIDDQGVLYLVNPLDMDRVQALLSQEHKAVRTMGVLAFHELDQITQGAADIQGDQSGGDKSEARRHLEGYMMRAVGLRASDIHLQPIADTAEVSMRVDGMLHKIGSLKLDEGYIALANTILDEAEKTAGEFIAPRDGQFAWPMEHRSINIRMSMVPVRVGQDVWPRFTLRLLGLELDLVDIDRLGLPSTEPNNQLDRLKEAMSGSSGLIVVSGPTGSGKTTTLNAGMRWLTRNHPRNSYFTIEDPVEIEIPQVSQVEVNPAANLTFAAGLRAFLRQDPDVIMVGEIRDEETMELAIRASLTGHIVLTTIHTKSAFGVVPRMLDMNIEPILLADALSGVMAQRTVRKVCQECSEQISLEDYMHLRHPFLKKTTDIFRKSAANIPARYGDLDAYPGLKAPIRVANPEGCNACRRGYEGRTILTEFSVIDEHLRDMITNRESTPAMERYAHGLGFRPLWEHGMQRITCGESTFSEVERSLGARTVTASANKEGGKDGAAKRIAINE
ncbi:MAG: GspE/PulE family protein [Salinisphaeraceae bacterium]